MSLAQHDPALLASRRRGNRGCGVTRSVYFVALITVDSTQSSGDIDTYWSCIWQLNSLPKVKNFLWRLGHDSLPTRVNLQRRGLALESLCPVCGVAPENSAHLFMSCAWASELWNIFFRGLNILTFAIENYFIWYFRMRSVLNLESWNVFNILLWLIWRNRNNDVHNACCASPASSMFEARKIMMDLLCAKASVDLPVSPLSWSKPPKGFIKVNSDAAVFVGDQKVGIGIVLRNCDGLVVTCKYLYFDSKLGILHSEALALLLGVKLSIQLGYPRVYFESDALLLIQDINSFRESFLPCRKPD